MDIGDSKMEKVDLKDVKIIAQGICTKYFFKDKDCEEKIESTLLEISGMNDYDEKQFFTLFSIAPLLFLNKQDNPVMTYGYIATALQQSIDLTKNILQTNYISSIPSYIEEMCQNHTKDKETCMDDVDRMLFMHMMTVNAISYLRKNVPLDSEFVYLLSHLMENISIQYTMSGNPEHGEKLIKTAKTYLDLLSKNIKKGKLNDKK